MTELKVKTVLGSNCFGTRMDLRQCVTTVENAIEFYSDYDKIRIDSAYFYGGGKSEECIGQMQVRLRNEVEIATKANPWDDNLFDFAGLRKQLEISLKRLQLDCVQIFYLHAPDSKTPIVESLKAVNDLYLENKFKEFGLSNYAAWQVAKICTICKNNGWIEPTVYQGMYNCLTRAVEKELLPCLRYFKLRFYAYNPLCGGILSGKHKIEDAGKTEPGRFFGESRVPTIYRARYWKKEIFDSVELIREVLQKVYGDKVTIAEASIRWLYHHSNLNGALEDGVIIGASSPDQAKMNLQYASNGPIDKKVVDVMDECWKRCCNSCSDYFR